MNSTNLNHALQSNFLGTYHLVKILLSYHLNFLRYDNLFGFSFGCHLAALALKGTVKRAKRYKFDSCLILRIFWYMSITPPLKEWILWHLMLTGIFLWHFLLTSVHSTIPVKAVIFIGKSFWGWMLQANKKEVPEKALLWK